MNRIFMVLLIASATAIAGCKFELEDNDTERIFPIAIIEASGTSGTEPFTVAFDGSKSLPELGQITSYWWVFGDGAESAGPVVAHEYTTPGTYQVMLIVTNSADLASQATKIITVVSGGGNLAPTADVSASPLSGDAPLEVSFDGSGSSDTDGTVTGYAWYFGDGGSATGQTANHIYTKAGTFNAILVVTDDSGSSGSAQVTITITGIANLPPTAFIEVSPLSGNAPLEVAFSGSKSSDSDGYIASYSWDFGDGNFDSGINPVHTYEAGNYTAILTVTDNAGDTDTTQVDITVNAPPSASADANPTTGDAPLTVDFDGSASTDTDGYIAEYLWNFGDGNTDTGATANHIYNTPGPYTAILTVTDDSGAVDSVLIAIDVTGEPNEPPVAVAYGNPSSGTEPLEISFSATDSSDDGLITVYSWDFGDSSSGSGDTVTHTYGAGSYTAMLTVTDNGGLASTALVNIFVNAGPVSSIYADTTSGSAPLNVQFDGSGSTDSDGTITAYTWYFGDGATGTGAIANHSYSTAGTYTATLVVTDDFGGSGTSSVTITVTGGAPNQPPVANISAIPASGSEPLEVSFSGSASSDDGTITDYFWDFGDGGTASGENVSHTYSAGSYTATLTVTDDGSLTDVAIVNITVNALPTASIDAIPTSGTEPLEVSFDASGSSDIDGSIVSYSWDFGDGGTATEISPEHTYMSAGTYTAVLVVTDNAGTTDLASVTISVSAAVNIPPVAVISATPLTGDAPLDVSFDALGSYDSDGSVDQYSWNFGDGEGASGATASHTYENAGTYIAQLTIIDNQGEFGYATVEISVLGNGPSAVIQADVYHGLERLTVNFNGTGSSAGSGTIESFNWNFGDGSSSTLTSPSHIFDAGVYWVTLTITDNFGRTGQAQTVIAVATFEEEVVRLTNVERWTADGGAQLPPLKKESRIDDAALRHSTDMAVNNHFSHTGTDGSSPGDRLWDAGYSWFTYGENIAAGYTTPAAVMAGWMASPGHHANIMRTSFREIGVSYLYLSTSSYRHWWTQDFGTLYNIFPVVINREEIATNSSTVNLYIYGSGWATQMMISNSSTFAGAAWETFTPDKVWTLEPGLGIRNVYVKLTNGGSQITYSDSIVVVEQ